MGEDFLYNHFRVLPKVKAGAAGGGDVPGSGSGSSSGNGSSSAKGPLAKTNSKNNNAPNMLQSVIQVSIGWYGKTKKIAKLEMQYLCIDKTTPRSRILQLQCV